MAATKYSERRLLTASLLAVAALGLGPACAPPAQDEFRSEGGASPDPTGVFEGTILYAGPHPSCEYQDGRATRVAGRVLLTLFEYDNPPPPAGTATSAINLFAISGDQLFSLADCLPEGAEADPAATITRLTSFRWPQITLREGASAEYQIRGFYDADEDMNPFFSVKNLPTAGDVIGAALEDPLAPSKGLAKIELPAREQARDGYLRPGVTVTLGSYVWTERPAFALSSRRRAIDAQAVSPVAFESIQDFSLCFENPLLCVNSSESLRQMHCGAKDPADCDGSFLEAFDQAGVGPVLEGVDVQLDFDPLRYVFVSEPVDLVTIRKGAPDLSVPDGKIDPHPLLGVSVGVPYYSPAILMQRRAPLAAQSAIEKEAGVPEVLMLGSPLLQDDGQQPLKRAYRGRIPVALPPIAVVQLDPERPECRLPYLPPGNFNSAYEARLTYCSDLPTGLFSLNVFQGIAGGAPVAAVDAGESDNGRVIEGGSLSGQAWSIPNELADPEQVGAANVLPSQGVDGMVVVHDPDPDAMGDCSFALDPLPIVTGGSSEPSEDRMVAYRGVCEADESFAMESSEGIDTVACLPEYCCEGISHLCGVELCPVCDAATCPGVDLGGLNVRSGPTEIVRVDREGRAIPNCVPFELPTLCCDLGS